MAPMRSRSPQRPAHNGVALSDAWAFRVGMAAVGMLLGIAVALAATVALFASGHESVSIARAVLGGGLIGIASGLVYPTEVENRALRRRKVHPGSSGPLKPVHYWQLFCPS